MFRRMPPLNPVRQQQSSRLMVVVAVLMAFLMGLSGFNPSVICYGTDGHVAIEDPLTGFCHPESTNSLIPSHPSAIHQPNTSAGYHNQTHHCIDVPLRLNQAAHNLNNTQVLREQFEKSTPYTALGMSHTLNSFLKVAVQGLLPHPPPSTSFQLAVIRTVRLLI